MCPLQPKYSQSWTTVYATALLRMGRHSDGIRKLQSDGVSSKNAWTGLRGKWRTFGKYSSVQIRHSAKQAQARETPLTAT